VVKMPRLLKLTFLKK